MFIPEVPEQEKLADKIMWKNEEGTKKKIEGEMFGPINEYAVFVPKTQTVTFGRLVSKYKAVKSRTYLKSGPARMDTYEKTIVGHLNDAKMWINGRLEMEKETKIIIYRKYDHEGKKVDRSLKVFVDFEWTNPENRKPAQKKKSDNPQRIGTDPMKHGIQKQKSVLSDTLQAKPSPSREKKDVTDYFEIPITVKGQVPSTKNMSRQIYDIPITFTDENKPSTENCNKFENLKGSKNVLPQTKKERKPSSNVENKATTTTSTLTLTGAEAESYLKDMGINLEAFGRKGSSSRNITFTKNTTIVGSTG